MNDTSTPLTPETWEVLNRILAVGPFGHRIKGDPDEGEWHCTCGDENEYVTAEQHIAEVVFRGAFPFARATEAGPLDADRLAKALLAVSIADPGLISDADMMNDPTENAVEPAAKAIAAEYNR